MRPADYNPISPSRTYVVFIYTIWMRGTQKESRIEPRYFTMPEGVEHNTSIAIRYYMRELDAFNVAEGLVLTKEEFDAVKEAK